MTACVTARASAVLPGIQHEWAEVLRKNSGAFSGTVIGVNSS